MAAELSIYGGRVLDPSTGLDEPRTVVIAGGRVAALLRPGETVLADQAVDAAGCLVTPGLVDFHAHFFHGLDFAMDPDRVFPAYGVTAAGDAGTCGVVNFAGFRRWVIEPSPLTLRAFLNLSVLGLSNVRRMADFAVREVVDADATVRVLAEHKDRLLGLKVRYQADQLGVLGREALPLAAAVARRAGVPLAVHVTGAPEAMPDYLQHFQAGDILMHPYHPTAPGGLLDQQGRVHPAARAARERGVLFDLGRAVRHFNWAIAEAAAAQGFWPDFLSSDMVLHSCTNEAVSLPGMIAQFLHLGMSLPEIIARMTWRPAAAMGLAGEIGTLRPGARADVTVWRQSERPREVPDWEARNVRTIIPWFEAVCTIAGGRIVHRAGG